MKSSSICTRKSKSAQPSKMDTIIRIVLFLRLKQPYNCGFEMIMSIMKHLASGNEFLHKIDKIYVKVRTRELTVRVNKNYKKVGRPLSKENSKILREISAGQGSKVQERKKSV